MEVLNDDVCTSRNNAFTRAVMKSLSRDEYGNARFTPVSSAARILLLPVSTSYDGGSHGRLPTLNGTRTAHNDRGHTSTDASNSAK